MYTVYILDRPTLNKIRRERISWIKELDKLRRRSWINVPASWISWDRPAGYSIQYAGQLDI
jgi:hypothetical protein